MSDKGDKLSSLLNVGHFGKSGKGPASADPLQETRIQVTLDEVRAYDHNPRQSENERFEEIKESIQVTGGLKSTLNITRRPGDDHYIVSTGGNSRLQALRELFEETSDERFDRFYAVFQPWESEIRVLTDHLIENDLRADLTFIDQALALRKLREEMEREAGEQLSLRRFETALKKVGYAKSNSLLSRMDYAVDVLWPLIPRTLSSGMGKHQIVQLRRLHKAYQGVWTINADGAPGDDPRFVGIFEETLKQLDETGFDMGAFQEALNQRLSDLFRLPGAHYIAQGIANKLRGSPNDDIKFPSPSDGERPMRLVAVPPAREPAAGRTSRESGGTPAPAHSEGAPFPDEPPTQDKIPLADRAPSDDSAPQDLQSLRRQAYKAAQRFAEAVDPELIPCILPYEEGLGYLVELPGRSFNVKHPDNAGGNRHQLLALNIAWWTLVSLSEVILINPKYYKKFPEGFLYAKWVRTDPAKIYDYVGILEYQAFGKVVQNPALFDALDELRDLMHAGQRIRSQATDDPNMGLSLWPTVFSKD